MDVGERLVKSLSDLRDRLRDGRGLRGLVQSRYVTCERCLGTGDSYEEGMDKCTDCGGLGVERMVRTPTEGGPRA